MNVADTLSVAGAVYGGSISVSKVASINGVLNGTDLRVGDETIPATSFILGSAATVTHMRTISIHANTVTLPGGSKLLSSAVAPNAGPGTGGVSSIYHGGATHGGSGSYRQIASDRTIIGAPYGSYLFPADFGSRGATGEISAGIESFHSFGFTLL